VTRSSSGNLLLVEDEPHLLLTLAEVLQSWGYVLKTATNGEAALALTQQKAFDLIILDIMLPVLSGLDVCKELRRRGVQTPILMLTAMDQVKDKVTGLRTGADDYVTKPFAMGELQARIEALTRRPRRDAPEAVSAYEFGGMRADFEKATLTRNGQMQVLTERESRLLRYFVENRGKVVSREALLLHVWGWGGATTYTRTVDVHVVRLRQKIETDARSPQFIVTVHGLGYRFTG
jgi:two-component system, OmpR family, alkaline phosphatase synthesis response regulator PhoP